MKKIACIWLCFFHLIAFTVPARANVAVGVIAAGAIGLAMAASTGGSYYSTSSAPIYQAVNAAASGADYLFQPAKLAAGPFSLVTLASMPAAASVYIGKDAHVGASLSDIKDFVTGSTSTAYSYWKTLFSSNVTGGGIDGTLFNTSVPNGSVAQTTTGIKVALTYSSKTGTDGSVMTGNYNAAILKFPLSPTGGCFSTSGSNPNASWHCWNGSSYNGTWMTAIYVYNGVQTNADVTLNPTPVVTTWPSIKTALNPASAGLASQLPQVLKDMPAAKTKPTVTANSQSPAATLTAAEVNAGIAANTAAVAAKAAADAATIAAANVSDAAAQIAAKEAAVTAAQTAAQAAQADVAQQEAPKEETFAGISNSAFAEPYNPGEFDIAQRFSNFIDTMKSAPLFSFSTSFFNSLPGGGSPVYEVEAGSYGHHTIDLSSTMGGAMAVIKSILLVLFSYLSIRAIILKR